LQMLMEAGADPNHAANDRTPLASARANHHKAAALALVQAGAIESRRRSFRLAARR
jgi:hypothetical protein